MTDLDHAHIGDIGTEIELTVQDVDGVAINLSSVTGQEIIIRDPQGTDVVQASTFVTDGVNGKIHCFTAAEFTIEGQWCAMAHVTFPGGDWTSTPYWFKVDD